jgi:hypothetical protein
LFILLVFGFHRIVEAQCSFELTVDVVQNSTCVSNGIVRVTLSGNDIDLSNVFISLTNNETINEQSSENGRQFGTLPPGQYTVNAQSVCKSTQNPVTRSDTITVVSEYSGLNATVSGERNSLRCLTSGMVLINTRNGRLPYRIEITSKPVGYIGDTVFTVHSSGTMTFDNLVSGDYVFTVSDNCACAIPLSVTIETLDSDFPSNPFADYFYPTGCNRALVDENYTSGGINAYWNSYREFYEIAFTLDDAKSWMAAQYLYTYYVDLPSSYNALYLAGAKMKVYLRLKNTECEQLVDEIRFTEIAPVNIYFYAEQSCDNYALFFHLSDEYSLCKPFKWEVFDEADTLVDSGEKIDNWDTRSIERLSYNQNYVLKITDGNGTTMTTDVRYERDAPYLSGYWVSKQYLLTHDLFFDMEWICLPYSVEVYDENDRRLSVFSNISIPYDTVRGLGYGKSYRIKIVDNVGRFAEIYHYFNKPDGVVCDSNNTGSNILFGCDRYSILIKKPVEIDSLFTWSARDGNGTTLSSSSNSDGLVTGLEYDKEYVLVFKDSATTLSYTVNLSLPYPYFFDVSEYGYRCNDYELRFDVRNVICYPYRVEVDNNGKSVYDYTVATSEYQTLKLEYDKEYRIRVTDHGDGANRSLDLLWSKTKNNNLSPYVENVRHYDDQCQDYGVEFVVQNVICFPYKWEAFKNDGTLFTEGGGFTELQPEHRTRLEYNTDYIIKVSDGSGNYSELPYRLDRESSNYHFIADYEMSNCVYDSHNGYIRINGRMDAGVRVRFVGGPKTPVHVDTVLTESTTEFYPFSEAYQSREYLPMIAGDYEFEVTSSCGNVTKITVACYPELRTKGFSYTRDDVSDLCQDMTRIYPHGRVYSYGVPDETWFTMTESPVPELIGTTFNWKDPWAYFSLSEKGRYVIEIRRSWDGCGIDTLVIDYTKESLDEHSSSACEEGAVGRIHVQAKNGLPPYTCDQTALMGDKTVLCPGGLFLDSTVCSSSQRFMDGALCRVSRRNPDDCRLNRQPFSAALINVPISMCLESFSH